MPEKQPDFAKLTTQIDLQIPLIGLYDAPNPEPFAPLITPQPGECVFRFYPDWLEGRTLHLTEKKYGCGG